jgi:predicted small secreted protein
MRKLANSPILVLLALLLSGCGLNSVSGSGNITSESRTISGVSSVSLAGTGQLIIEQTGNEALTITADDNLLPYLSSDVRGSKLVLGIKDGTNISPSKEVVYRLEVKKLDEIEVSGAGTVEAKGINTDRLSVNGAGSTAITAAGQAERQEISITGSGEYKAAELQSKEVEISITGSGNAVLAVSDKLDATVTGAGSIQYIGDPVVSKNVTGAASIEKRDAK